MKNEDPLPDYCDVLDSDLIKQEIRGWESGRGYLRYASAVRSALPYTGVSSPSVVELGCGAGYVGGELSGECNYIGVDGNTELLEIARSKFPGVVFMHGNLRDGGALPRGDLVCTFSVIKHFGMNSWRQVVTNILGCGRFGLLQLQTRIVGPSVDTIGQIDHRRFHHTWLNYDEVLETVERAGHRLIEVLEDLEAPGAPEGARERMLFTCRA